MENEIKLLKSLDLNKISTTELEHFLPLLGMNNEDLNQMPAELNSFFGKGLHFWQYPNQLSKFINFIHNKNISSYLEIGCRWGGTFILLNEVIKKYNPNLQSYACDIIPMSNLLHDYKKFSNFSYVQENSQNIGGIKNLLPNQIDFILIDGDHNYEGVKNDYQLAMLLNPKYIMFHDITSDACPGVGKFWNEIKNNFSYHEYTDQYDSVNGNFLGIGLIEVKE